MDSLGSKELPTDETEAVLVEVEGQHSTFPNFLELSKEEHKDGNDSVSDNNNNLMAQERFIPATPKDYDNFLLTSINKNTNNAAERKVCVN